MANIRLTLHFWLFIVSIQHKRKLRCQTFADHSTWFHFEYHFSFFHSYYRFVGHFVLCLKCCTLFYIWLATIINGFDCTKKINESRWMRMKSNVDITIFGNIKHRRFFNKMCFILIMKYIFDTSEARTKCIAINYFDWTNIKNFLLFDCQQLTNLLNFSHFLALFI